MSESAKGQVSASAAEVYEEFFLPALFAPWTDLVISRPRADEIVVESE